MSAAIRKIALWGFGRYGKRLYDAINTHWGKRYSITAVFDSSVGEADRCLIDGAIPLVGAEMLPEFYGNGCFEAVLVSVAVDARKEMEARLEELGIPVITLIDRCDLHPFEAFANTSARSLSHGFTVHEYRSLLGFYSPLYSWQTPFYCFDGEGRYPEDMWYLEHLDWDSSLKNPAIAPDTDAADIVDLPGEYCLAAYLWARNYWHFTYQTLDRIMLMEEAGFTGTYLLVRSSMAEELLSLLGLKPERVLWLDDLDARTLYRFERLLLVSNGSPDYDSAKSAEVLMDVAKRIEARALAEAGATEVLPDRIFVKRTGTRKLNNIDSVLRENGFKTIVPEELSVAEQVRYFNHAKIVISPHGANSTNSLYMQPGSVFIEAFSNKWANPCCVDTLYKKDINYLPIAEMSIKHEIKLSMRDDFEVDNTILQMLIRTASRLVG